MMDGRKYKLLKCHDRAIQWLSGKNRHFKAMRFWVQILWGDFLSGPPSGYFGVLISLKTCNLIGDCELPTELWSIKCIDKVMHESLNVACSLKCIK